MDSPLTTTPTTALPSAWERFKDSISVMLVITLRELHDQFRDWRILVPVVFLTIIFPSLMNWTAGRAVAFVEDYNATEIGNRLIPFLLMIVGFFPISVSLVIALESFVGEKERKSIEPLLSSPLSDVQLYFGKLLASLAMPLISSYLGIAVYLFGVNRGIGWEAEPILLVQILLLTFVQAVLMVSGAVVVSSQTTSVRAANLLSSFIIIPMTFLIQGESIVMFWALYDVLWWAILGQLVIVGLLIRTGLAYFNREEMLGRELDVLDIRGSWRLYKRNLRGEAHNLGQWYRQEVFPAVYGIRIALGVVVVALLIGAWAGVAVADDFPLPRELVDLSQVNEEFIDALMGMGFYSTTGVAYIWLHNLRSMLLATILGIFTFGVLALLVLMLPTSIIAYLAANLAAAGQPWGTFLVALVLPHGLIEFPAMILAGGAILSLGATLAAPAQQGKTLGEAFIISLARWTKIMFGLVIPLFLLAAVVEVFITPHIAVRLLGGL